MSDQSVIWAKLVESDHQRAAESNQSLLTQMLSIQWVVN